MEIKNPYKTLDEELCCRLQLDVAIADKNLIRVLCPEHGIFSNMVASFIASVATEMRHLNIQTWTPENERTLIESIKRRTSNLPESHTSASLPVGPAGGIPRPEPTPSVGDQNSVPSDGPTNDVSRPQRRPIGGRSEKPVAKKITSATRRRSAE